MVERDLFTPPPTVIQKSLLDARVEFNATLNREHKAMCPVCDRQASIWRRSLNAPLARALIAIFHHDRLTPGWIHLVTEFDYKTLGGEYGKLSYWGLLESQRGQKRMDGNPTNGYYRITEKGKAFALNQIKVRDHVYIYNDTVLEIEDDQVVEVSIKDVMAREFNYDELMSGVDRPATGLGVEG